MKSNLFPAVLFLITAFIWVVALITSILNGAAIGLIVLYAICIVTSILASIFNFISYKKQKNAIAIDCESMTTEENNEDTND